MDAFRAINELVFALVFVAAVGLGPLAGVLALTVHTTGTLAKLFSEAVEAIDPRPVEGIRATGRRICMEIVFGVIPQVLPLWISFSLYRFEANVRSATVLGIVGAGGIGMSLSESCGGSIMRPVPLILLIIFVTVSFDIFGARLRKVVIDGEDHALFVGCLAILTALSLELKSFFEPARSDSGAQNRNWGSGSTYREHLKTEYATGWGNLS